MGAQPPARSQGEDGQDVHVQNARAEALAMGVCIQQAMAHTYWFSPVRPGSAGR
jgi:hypothetical protein